jgi:hypothetical protein
MGPPPPRVPGHARRAQVHEEEEDGEEEVHNYLPFCPPNFIMNIQPLARTGCCCGQTTESKKVGTNYRFSFFAQQGGGGDILIDRFDPTAGIGGYGSTMAPGMLAAAGAAAAGGRPVAGGGTGGATGVAAGTSAAMQVR